MTILGLILLIGGGVMTYLAFTDSMPAQLATLPIPAWGWLIVAAVGGLLMFFNRRPGD